MSKKITTEQLIKLMSDGSPVKLIDVLSREHYQREHIKGAISMPVYRIREEAQDLFDKDDLIVVYCASRDCQASTSAAEEFISLGYSNVFDYKGGLKDYKKANLPLAGSRYKQTTDAGSCTYC